VLSRPRRATNGDRVSERLKLWFGSELRVGLKSKDRAKNNLATRCRS
jgi:hypothetical protein